MVNLVRLYNQNPKKWKINIVTVGTQAAVLASLDIAMLIEFHPLKSEEWGEYHNVPRALKFFCFCFITSAFCSNMAVVSQTTLLCLLGSTLALRGPDGSMITATDGLYAERRSVFVTFGLGLASTMVSVAILVWLKLPPDTAVVCMSIALIMGMKMYINYLRVSYKFSFDENQTVDFTDIFEGPAAISVVPNMHLKEKKSTIGKDQE